MNRWAVNWYEGMPLAAQHFQAADRHLARRVDEAEDWASPFAWGLRKLVLAIRHDEVSLDECEARFTDGTKLCIPEDLEPGALRAPLGDALKTAGASATVYLTIPVPGPGRFEKSARAYEDEDGVGEPVEVELRKVKASLVVVVGEERPTGALVIPLAKVKRSARAGAPPEVDPDFIPPLIAVAAWPPLTSRVRGLASRIHALVDQLAARLNISGRFAIDPRQPEDAIRALRFAAFSAVDAQLRSVASMTRLAPWYVFLELCRAAGQVAPFRLGRKLDDLPEYRHDDLGDCFDRIIRQIEGALDEEEPPPFDVHPFRRVEGNRLEVALIESWFRENRPIYLAVATRLEPGDCDYFLSDHDLAIASVRDVGGLLQNKLRGLELALADPPPPGTSGEPRRVIFRLEDPDGAWKDARASSRLAIQFNPRQATFQGAETVTLHKERGERVDFTFSLLVYKTFDRA